MGDGNFTVDPGTLERLSTRVRAGASDLDKAAGNAPDAPDAGVSTPAVTGALAEISRAVIGLNETMTQIADNVVQGHGTYHEIDESNAADIQGQLPR